EIDAMAVDAALGVEPVDIDAQHLDHRRLRGGRRTSHRRGDAHRVVVLRIGRRERQQARGGKGGGKSQRCWCSHGLLLLDGRWCRPYSMSWIVARHRVRPSIFSFYGSIDPATIQRLK